MNPSLKNKIALVTGAAGGIGQATAFVLAQKGAIVIVSDINEDQGQETVGTIHKSGGMAEFITLDVSNKEQVDEVTAKIVDAYGKLDLAVNNAGIGGIISPLHEVTEANWNRMMAINLTGQFYCLQTQIKAMLSNGSGNIVNVASLAGLIGVPRGGPYSVAKHGVVSLTKTAAKEYATHNIRVNAVCPGFIETDILQTIPQQLLDFAKEYIVPTKRLGKAFEVANTIAYLLSDESSYITGTAINIDGGQRA